MPSRMYLCMSSTFWLRPNEECTRWCTAPVISPRSHPDSLFLRLNYRSNSLAGLHNKALRDGTSKHMHHPILLMFIPPSQTPQVVHSLPLC